MISEIQAKKLIQLAEKLANYSEDTVYQELENFVDCYKQFLAAGVEKVLLEDFPAEQQLLELLPGVIAEIKQHTNNAAEVIEVLDNIVNKHQENQKTKCDPRLLLVRCWLLAKHNCDLYKDKDNLKDALVNNLLSNKLDGGGCIEGINVRLIHFYVVRMVGKLEQYVLQCNMLHSYQNGNNNAHADNLDNDNNYQDDEKKDDDITVSNKANAPT